MSLQIPESTNRPYPIRERAGEGMFTDREEEMASLMSWVNEVTDKYGRSRALVSHRRYGKTSIMERFYNRLFWERTDVMPFYFELKENTIWIRQLVEDYFFMFMRQFLAYRTNDADLAFERPVSLEDLHDLAKKLDETIILEFFSYWEDLKKKDEWTPGEIQTVFHNLPHMVAARTGLGIIVMFDEFQRLDQVLYYDKALTRKGHKYTGSFATAAESSRAPMLIAGSQVTILTDEALSGAMIGRVGAKYIKRLPRKGAAQLAIKFAERKHIPLSLDYAYTISRLVDGHPYYIWSLFNSENPDIDFSNKKGIKAALAFEIENRVGYINKFWKQHFLQNLETLNRPYTREILLYLSKYPDTEIYVDQLISDLGLPLSIAEANEFMYELLRCDLVRERGHGLYGGLSDPVLEWMLRIEYGWEIEQMRRDEAIAQMNQAMTQQIIEAQQELINSLRGDLRYWTGRFAEMFIDKLMKRHFAGQHVDGAYFHQDGDIQLPLFESIFTTMTQPPGATQPYQIDLYGVPRSSTLSPWVVEVKNWQTVVSQPNIQHFWDAVQNLAKDRGHTQMVCWFYSRSGFSEPARDFMDEKGILYTDETKLIQMLEDLNVIDQWQDDMDENDE
ncbi:MAG: restriction endonuclease [Chloroflexota bacterium]